MSTWEKRNELVLRYSFFALMLVCMLLASFRPDLGGVNGRYDKSSLAQQSWIGYNFSEYINLVM